VSAYLKFFELERSPFEGKAQSQVVLGTRALRDAFGTIRSGLDEHASRICVSGAAGLGKTSLARALPKLLGDEVRVAHVPDAAARWADCRDGIARQWGLVEGRLSRTALVEARANQRLVLVIDRAERADEAFLDHLDVLLSYRTEEDTPVVQSVLLANLVTGEGETPAPLLWWLDRIQTLQLEFAPLPRDGVASYIAKHLRRAGWRGDALFSEEAGFAIHGHAGGIPGEISALCEKLLVEAASRGRTDIDAEFVHAICDPQPEEEPEANWTVPDEFEALIAESDFSGAEDATESTAPEADGVPVEDASTVEPVAAAPRAEASPEERRATIDEPGTDETAVLHFDADEADRSDEAESPLVFTEGSDPGMPFEAGEDADEAEVAIELAEEVADGEAEAPRDLADALEFFESAAVAESGAAASDDGSAAIELAEVVEETDGDDPSTESEDEEAPWTFAIDDMEPDADPEMPGAPATDAAFAPEPETAADLSLDAPLLDDELAAFRGLSSSMGWKPVALAAVAATIAGLVFLSFGTNESPGPEPPPMVAKKEAPGPERVLATPGRGYVDPRVLERLPKDALAQAIAAAEAQQPGWAQGGGGREEDPVRPAAPVRNMAEAGPESARRDENGPAVKDEATAKIDPTLVKKSSSAEESPGIDTASTPLAKRAPLDSTDGAAPQAAMPAAPSAPSATAEEDRFW